MASELKHLNISDMTESIKSAWERYIVQENQQTPSCRPHSYASSYEECERKMVLYMTNGDKLPPFEPQVLAKFHRGNDRERNLKIDLSRVGQLCDPKFEVIGQQERFELKNRRGRIIMTGKFDCRLQFGQFQKPPLEIKDWNENLTARISTFEDCFRSPWTKKGAFQILMYLLGSGEPFGFLLLGKSGLPTLIPVTLEDHLEIAEEFLAKAERAFDHKENGTFPDYISDYDECRRCQFYGVACTPPISSGEGAVIYTDPEEEARLTRMLELKPLSDEYDEIKEWAKSRYRGVEAGVAGSVLIGGRWQRNTTYEIPPSAKEIIEGIKQPYKVVSDKGKWIPSFTKI